MSHFSPRQITASFLSSFNSVISPWQTAGIFPANSFRASGILRLLF